MWMVCCSTRAVHSVFSSAGLAIGSDKDVGWGQGVGATKVYRNEGTVGYQVAS